MKTSSRPCSTVIYLLDRYRFVILNPTFPRFVLLQRTLKDFSKTIVPPFPPFESSSSQLSVFLRLSDDNIRVREIVPSRRTMIKQFNRNQYLIWIFNNLTACLEFNKNRTKVHENDDNQTQRVRLVTEIRVKNLS